MKKTPLDSLQNQRGFAAAHEMIRLLLLPLGPDKVHGIPLRRAPKLCKLSKSAVSYYNKTSCGCQSQCETVITTSLSACIRPYQIHPNNLRVITMKKTVEKATHSPQSIISALYLSARFMETIQAPDIRPQHCLPAVVPASEFLYIRRF